MVKSPMVFISCHACQRFVDACEATCPFCEVSIKVKPAKPTRGLRVARSAMLAALVAGSQACSMSTSPTDAGPDASVDATVDATSDASIDRSSDAVIDAVTDAELDAEVMDAPPVPPYGAPPPPDPDAG